MGTKAKVLVVDDEPVIADTLEQILNRNGFLATALYDGRAAIELAAEWRPDILLTDVVMPRMDGFEAAVHIAEAVPGCRVLLLSAQLHLERLNACRAEGFRFGYLLKPIHPADLITLLRAEMYRKSLKDNSVDDASRARGLRQILRHILPA